MKKEKKILVYLAHPAHFHLFKETIKSLKDRQIPVVITIKKKDVLENLLQENKIGYTDIGRKASGKGKAQKLLEFLQRLKKLASIIRKEKPSLLISSAPEVAVLGKWFGIPSMVFTEDDLEQIKPFALIAGTFSTSIVCPNCCSAWKWNHKKIGYEGYHELAYLHPHYFTPDFEKVKDIFSPDKKNFILRFAHLNAYHDKGKSGITTEITRQLIDILKHHGNIFITSERPIEPEFEKYRIQINVKDIHHALAFADIYIGDSQTMTAEAAVLGTPALRFNDFVGKLSYLDELELRYNLTYGIRTTYPERLILITEDLLNMPDFKEEWRRKRVQMLSEKIDVTQFFTEMILKKLGI